MNVEILTQPLLKLLPSIKAEFTLFDGGLWAKPAAALVRIEVTQMSACI